MPIADASHWTSGGRASTAQPPRRRTVPETPPDEHPPEAAETVPLGDDGDVVEQMNVGKDNMRGGGEWPDPDTPPSESAPGDLVSPPRGSERGTYKEALDSVSDERAASATSPPDDDDD
jgi:hypothetical protein